MDDGIPPQGEKASGPGNSFSPSELGKAGEEAAACLLRARGWRILARNWRPKGRRHHLELDLIAMEGDTLVFVEVKTRQRSFEKERGNFPTHAAFTVGKQRNLLQAARLYLTAQRLWEASCRFDLICVDRLPDGRLELELYTHVLEIGHSVDSGNASWQPW